MHSAGRRKTTYQPAPGPQQRRGILKGRRVKLPPTMEFSNYWKKNHAPLREQRRVLAKMFNFEPLTKLKSEERILLKKYARHFVNIAMNKLYIDYRWKNLRADKPDTQSMTKGESYLRLVNSGLWNAEGSQRYKEQGGFDVFELTKEAMSRSRQVVKVLDIGAETGQALAELKTEFGSKIETHAVSPSDVPRFPVDYYHMVFAEYLPKSFAGKYDLVFSHMAIDYALFPNIALRNIALSLAQGGKAVISMHQPAGKFFVQGYNEYEKRTAFDGELNRYFQKTPRISPAAYRLLLRKWRTSTRAKILRAAHEETEKNPIFLKQEILWLNAIASLSENPYYAVTVNRTKTWTPFPELVTIQRIR